MESDSASTGAWERSLILISVAVTVLGPVLVLALVLLSLPVETLQESFGGVLAPPWNMVLVLVLLVVVFVLAVFAVRYEKRALATDPWAKGSRYVDRALWRRLVITMPVAVWSFGGIWMFFIPSQVDQEHMASRTTIEVLSQPTLFQAFVLYGVPSLITLFMFFRVSRERRPGDEFYEPRSKKTP